MKPRFSYKQGLWWLQYRNRYSYGLTMDLAWGSYVRAHGYPV